MSRTDNTGLTPDEAAVRLARFGPNRLFTPAAIRFWAVAAEEITEPMILLLVVVGVLYTVWGGLGDALTIFTVILLLVGAEIGNEFRAKRAIAALERLSTPKVRVRRGGKITMADIESVVPGDVLVLVQGARLAADGKLMSAVNLSMDESTLTGESLPSEKRVGDAVSAGAIVVTGEGEAEVTATGSATRLGQMGTQLAVVSPPKTPLQLAMRSLAGKLVWVAVVFAIAIPLIGIARGGDVRLMVLTGLSLAFAVIPEELPIIITMVLGLGAYRLSRENFLVKRLRAAETLGDATVILTDKTGTLTESRMHVAVIWPAAQEHAVLDAALATASLALPDPLEHAVSERARALGIMPLQGEILRLRHPGDGRRTKAALWRHHDGSLRLHLTGAPEEVFGRSRSVPAALSAQLNAQTAQGRRVIAVAIRAVDTSDVGKSLDDLEHDLDVVGIISLADPPRTGVKETLARVTGAGVRTMMVTGDHPATAIAIAREVGIPADRIVCGEEVDRLDDAELARTASQVSVFARATPQNKYRLLTALQANGEIVAVTGDGVNDALALKAADVGVAMGLKGTDVAKEAAQAVLADDNYATLARGIFEGRHFFDNLRKGVNYYLAVKVGLIAIFLLPVLAGLPLPFSPIQIILLELFMDLAASAGFVAEPAEADIELRPPRRAGAALIDGAAVRLILLKGGLLFAAVMAAYAWARWRGLPVASVQSCAFAAWMAGHMALAFISRNDRDWILRDGLFSNRVMNLWAIAAIGFLLLAVYLPPLREALHFGALAPGDLIVAIALALLLLVPVELRKSLIRLQKPRAPKETARRRT
ncbi:cation-translocating P-type ATPase [Paraburkholderia mimosarum]|uniref:cation-translocating P-type ATPase n=1 Tax=Paraburkholderia mimosarum TaxID=312026 RepID=UPI0004080085|nr:cation-transporting P-type ATPase [Paraburkholderia mimosarum]